MKEEARQQIFDLAYKYQFEEGHSLQDARLALSLFDQTQELHDLPDDYRDLLEFAAILHDIGYWYGYVGHHKSAYRMIMDAKLTALTKREQRLVALIARYHRGARPKPTHKGFAQLSPDDQDAVAKLGSILRLADGLDRTHTDAVRSIEVVWLNDTLVIWVYPPYGIQTELWAGQKKSRFFQEVFDVPVRVLAAQ
ncbi:MAG: HD domain-containing protein [Chloroflexota bacterium]